MKKVCLYGSMALLFIAASVLPWVARTAPQDDAWTVLFGGEFEETMAAYAGGPTLEAPNETQGWELTTDPAAILDRID